MLTDLYQLTMNAGYFAAGKNDKATFDLFVRKLPKDWGFFIANGIEDAVDYSTDIGFEEELPEDDPESQVADELYERLSIKVDRGQEPLRIDKFLMALIHSFFARVCRPAQ